MEDWKNTKCGNCVIQRKKPICNSCIGHHYYRPMTNAQKIRSMTDEELAWFINTVSNDSIDTITAYGTKSHTEVWENKESTMQWLQSEAEWEIKYDRN